MQRYADFDGLLARVAAYGADLELLAEAKVGPSGDIVQGFWLHPYPSDDWPYFIDEHGAVYQARFVGEFVKDDSGVYPIARPVRLYPPAEESSYELEKLKLLTAIQLFFGAQARTEGAAQAEAQSIMREALDIWRVQI